MYGVDAVDTQAFGNTVDANGNPRGWDTGWNHGDYGWALPQLYATLAVGDLSVKLGHFYTLIGYEVVQAPDNFFYSHAFTFYNNEPFTHTGALASYNVSDNRDRSRWLDRRLGHGLRPIRRRQHLSGRHQCSI